MVEQELEFEEPEFRVITDADGKRRIEYSAARLTADEVKLLSLYRELTMGFIPVLVFEEVAEELTDVEDVEAALYGLLAKEVLIADSFCDYDREEYGLLPQGDNRHGDAVCGGVAYEPTLKKYLPQRE